MFEPLSGRREVLVTERRTAQDDAHAIRHPINVVSPAAEKIVLVRDNLPTHKPAARYAAFPPEKARRRIDKREIHDTPKPVSWLNMAEIERGVLQRQGIHRRRPTGPHCKPKSPLGSRLAMLSAGRPTGSSPHRTPESNASDSTQPANPSYKN